MRSPLLRLTNSGLYCEQGGFYIDPWSPAACAVVTHAHGDHAVKGSRRYLTAESGRLVLQHRMGPRAHIDGLAYGETREQNGVKLSLHPAGHILGSSQVRVESRDEVWVITGDYKVAPDATCAAFEPVQCHTFITESTFAHPVFHWAPQVETFAQIHEWWRENQQQDKACFLYAYSLGKAQRLVAGLDSTLGPIFSHTSIEEMNAIYRLSGVSLPETRTPDSGMTGADWSRALILLPPSVRWNVGFPIRGNFSTAFASGWMTLPEGPAQRRVHRGFALSDHADYGELLNAVAATNAERIFVTHGYIEEFVSQLRSRGYEALPHRTPRCQSPPRVPEMRQTKLAFP